MSKGYYSGEKLKDAIKRILDNGDDLSGMNLSNKLLSRIELNETNLYGIDFSESSFLSLNDIYYV